MHKKQFDIAICVQTAEFPYLNVILNSKGNSIWNAYRRNLQFSMHFDLGGPSWSKGSLSVVKFPYISSSFIVFLAEGWP